jgi:hypothetical protein
MTAADDVADDDVRTIRHIYSLLKGLPSDAVGDVFDHITRTRSAVAVKRWYSSGLHSDVALEAHRLKVRRLAQERDEADRLGGQTEAHGRMVSGGSFIYDLPAEVPCVWGDGKRVVWAQGEALTLTGPTGVGKTTVAGQVLRGRIIGGDVLGMKVKPTESKVLYLAMDRPQQIARALARVLSSVSEEVLEERFVVWKGPPMRDLALHPETLLEMAHEAGADTVFLDEVGAGYNRARQLCLASSIEVAELHHTVKSGADGKAPDGLEHVYGSAWITAGSGSVVSLFGKAGDPVVRWRHLKQPVEEVGPWDIEHDHEAGTTSIVGDVDVVDVARRAGDTGVTARAVAIRMFDTARPSKAEVAKARRRLEAKARAGVLLETPGDAATQTATTWYWCDPTADFGEIDPEDLI